MSAVLVIIHVIVCVALILIVLLQTGKAADMGAAFGGGSSQTLFGSTGASTFLSKATTVAAIVFMLTSLTLAYMSSNKTRQSVMENAKAPITQTAPDAETGMPAAADQASQPQETPPQPAGQK
ncbi:MAG: preprotein translocase subunit SecG [Desulfobacterales bacterium]|nr:preprotein translocase subunit SecG [Desulfobacterales bacterium]MDD3081592.1 preprotein translocase subunit SecG [Desulfobacterales bacterium]MDD3949725.1 preprotein translocase subunit SecG [Desulfobacterales bacterium]MDD4462659.1 preprotein translocase subunit SecG [Desulfobacterales bacterium]MDY0376927.1 preprotein translocase subunit SecG [Desulfobacterales bacterium]